MQKEFAFPMTEEQKLKRDNLRKRSDALKQDVREFYEELRQYAQMSISNDFKVCSSDEPTMLNGNDFIVVHAHENEDGPGRCH